MRAGHRSPVRSAPAPRFGWHQLDSRWATRLVADARVGADHLVLDIGAGTGALTAPLVARGAQVVAVELHQRRAAILRRRFQGRPVTVVVADASDLRLPRRPFRVVANPPFSVMTAILRRLVSPGSRLVRADLVVPAHLARACVSGRSTVAAGASARYRFATGRPLPRRALRPAPPHDVAVLVVTRRNSPAHRRR